MDSRLIFRPGRKIILKRRNQNFWEDYWISESLERKLSGRLKDKIAQKNFKYTILLVFVPQTDTGGLA